MDSYSKDEINRETQRKHLLLRFSYGIKGVFSDTRKALAVLAYLVGAFCVFCFRKEIVELSAGDYDAAFGALIDGFIGLLFILTSLLGFFCLIIILGTPLRATSVRNGFRRVGLVNHAGEVPLLLRQSKEKDCNVIIMEIEANGIPRSKWEDKRPDIETELNLFIVKITEGDSRRRILLHTVPAKNNLSQTLYWKSEYLSSRSFELVLGESLLGRVMVDIARIPHILLGGSTGSGKSVLLKLLLMQCIHKGATVYIADFKGGVDFPDVWSAHCKLIIDVGDLLETLEKIVEELELRKVLLRSSGCANLDEYNRNIEEALQRIVFACDEVAEILDKTGQNKDGKDRISSYENKLATIARQGRAFGIHLILATQRPDANILAGQIRNNLDCRICGRADNVLSQIILDSTAACDAIPKDAQGRFISGDGTIFQGYLFDERTVFG